MKIYCNVCSKYRKSEKIKILYIFLKIMNSFYCFYSKVFCEYEKFLKKKNQLKY